MNSISNYSMEYDYAKRVLLGTLQIGNVPVMYRNKVQMLVETPEDIVNYVRTIKWREIKTERDRLETAGLPFNGSVLDYNLRSAFKLEVAKSAAESAIKLGLAQADDIATTWTMQDNSEMNLTYSDLLSIPLAAKDYSNALHEKGRVLREKIYNCSSIEEIEAIKWE